MGSFPINSDKIVSLSDIHTLCHDIKIHKFPISYHDINFYVTIYDILPMSHSTTIYVLYLVNCISC